MRQVGQAPNMQHLKDFRSRMHTILFWYFVEDMTEDEEDEKHIFPINGQLVLALCKDKTIVPCYAYLDKESPNGMYFIRYGDDANNRIDVRAWSSLEDIEIKSWM